MYNTRKPEVSEELTVSSQFGENYLMDAVSLTLWARVALKISSTSEGDETRK